MSQPQLPSHHKVAIPKPIDPKKVSDTYVNRVTGIDIRDGIVHVTFSIIRTLHDGTAGPPKQENVVEIRLALPLSAMNALVAGYQRLQSAMNAQQMMGKPN